MSDEHFVQFSLSFCTSRIVITITPRALGGGGGVIFAGIICEQCSFISLSCLGLSEQRVHIKEASNSLSLQALMFISEALH